MEYIGNLTDIHHRHEHASHEPDPFAAIMPFIYVSLSGSITALFYFFMSWAKERFMRMFTSTLQLKNSDNLYNLVLKFLVDGNYLEHQMTHMSAKVKPKEWVWWWK